MTEAHTPGFSRWNPIWDQTRANSNGAYVFEDDAVRRLKGTK